ncbi:MAG: hypothetical protein KF760_03815 [Candidatus Eremiobacteraeota bacterium]|nr:hypothetical protein [Candidatus Eremiobacteraeota bacterium]MCW5870101.1 hypothetical protein [Candidatus Eremiobacteraeota bacterium]
MRWLWSLLALCILSGAVLAEERVYSYSLLVDAEPSQGFCWPYYLYVPPRCVQGGEQDFPLLVLPNNTGKVEDDDQVHVQKTGTDLAAWRRLADELGCVLVSPAFPRPANQWQLYTHALDRDTLLRGSGDLNRLDLQMLATLHNARLRLAAHHVRVRPKSWMMGFSAAGMFANRFALLHPEAVERVAVGSPGGWPMAPVARSGGENLPYPVGAFDLINLTGKPLQTEEARHLRFFFFLGDKDDNDSVAYDDGYDAEERALVHRLFGLTPVERWPKAEKLYQLAQMNALFRLYPGVGHEMTPAMRDDVIKFFLTP